MEAWLVFENFQGRKYSNALDCHQSMRESLLRDESLQRAVPASLVKTKKKKNNISKKKKIEEVSLVARRSEVVELFCGNRWWSKRTYTHLLLG